MVPSPDRLPRFREIDIIEIPLDDPGWNLAGWYVHQDGEMKLAAVAVFPGTDRDSVKSGEFDLQTPDVVNIIKESALTTTILRDVQLMKLRDAFESWRIERESDPLPLPPVRHKGRPPGRRLQDEHYLPWARRFAQLVVQREKHPRKVMALESDVTSEFVRDMISRCRQRGLLTRSGPGRSGGELTPKAKTLIAELEGEEL